MEFLNFFLEVFKDIEAVATSLFKNWDKIEDVSIRFIGFVENFSISILNKWYPV